MVKMIVMNIRDIILLSLFSAAALTSCRKEFEKVDDVDFDVHATSSVFKVGEPAVFEMSGNPDFITFYSGETGSDYAYKDTDRIIETEMTLSFTTTTTSGTVGHPNPAAVPVAWSDDFSGEYTEEAVRNATWHDITDEFTMPDNTGITQLFSDNLYITPFYADEDKPIYFSFHYCVDTFDQSAAGGAGNGRTQWNFQSVSFNGVAGETVSELYDLVGAGWKLVLTDSYDDQSALPDISSSRILFRSDFRPTHDLECWAVSGPIYKMDYINNGPDRGLGIKSVADADMTSYSYTFNEPGVYDVAFVAANANVYDRKEVVRHLTVEIVEDEGSIENPGEGEWK